MVWSNKAKCVLTDCWHCVWLLFTSPPYYALQGVRRCQQILTNLSAIIELKFSYSARPVMLRYRPVTQDDIRLLQRRTLCWTWHCLITNVVFILAQWTKFTSSITTGWVKKSRPFMSFIDIFAWAQSPYLPGYKLLAIYWNGVDFTTSTHHIYGFKFRLFSNQCTLQKCRVPAYGKWCYCFRQQMFNVM